MAMVRKLPHPATGQDGFGIGTWAHDRMPSVRLGDFLLALAETRDAGPIFRIVDGDSDNLVLYQLFLSCV